MKYEGDEVRELLAAEYALGLLRGRARDRFLRLAEGDPALRALADSWSLRFGALAETTSPVEPAADLLARIEARLGIPAEPVRAAPRVQVERVREVEEPAETRLWDRLAFWRNLAFLTSAATAALIFYVLSGPMLRSVAPGPTHLAVLADAAARPAIIAELDEAAHRLTVRPVQSSPLDPAQVLELWLLPAGGGAPQSLGLLQPGRTELPLATAQPLQVAGAALAVSLEPAGGSPTGQPTGPVLYSGPLQPLL